MPLHNLLICQNVENFALTLDFGLTCRQHKRPLRFAFQPIWPRSRRANGEKWVEIQEEKTQR